MAPIVDQRIVLVVGCEKVTNASLEAAIKSLGLSAKLSYDIDQALSFLQTFDRELIAVFWDVSMSGNQGTEAIREIHRVNPNVPVIVVGTQPSTGDVVDAMRNGAADFLSKPIKYELATVALTRALEIQDGAQDNGGGSVRGEGFFAGSNARMRELQCLAKQVGQSNVSVLIQGETGSGKEVLARELHRRSPRAGRCFLKLNCAALPSELVESELFGYERGAFTGATQRKMGMFELADGGTLMLDEIGDMDVRLQAKLLQVLQDGEFRRIGGKGVVKVDVRIIAATHCDLETAIQNRAFREDLFYRLNVVNLVLPPLRERAEDIVPIAEFLLDKHCEKGKSFSLSSDLKQAMIDYHWPGNVRELENCVLKLIVLQDCGFVARDLRARSTRKKSGALRVVGGSSAVPERSLDSSMLEEARRAKDQTEIDVILSTLQATHWNRKQAAAVLRIEYKSLLYKMKKLGIEDGAMPIRRRDGFESSMNAPRSAIGH